MSDVDKLTEEFNSCGINDNMDMDMDIDIKETFLSEDLKEKVEELKTAAKIVFMACQDTPCQLKHTSTTEIQHGTMCSYTAPSMVAAVILLESLSKWVSKGKETKLVDEIEVDSNVKYPKITSMQAIRDILPDEIDPGLLSDAILPVSRRDFFTKAINQSAAYLYTNNSHIGLGINVLIQEQLKGNGIYFQFQFLYPGINLLSFFDPTGYRTIHHSFVYYLPEENVCILLDSWAQFTHMQRPLHLRLHKYEDLIRIIHEINHCTDIPRLNEIMRTIFMGPKTTSITEDSLIVCIMDQSYLYHVVKEQISIGINGVNTLGGKAYKKKFFYIRKTNRICRKKKKRNIKKKRTRKIKKNYL
jgi:hypothetical protein